MVYKDKDAYNLYMNEYMKDRYKRRRYESIVALGGKCVKCGSIEDLEFDHIDRMNKTFTIGNGSSFSDKRWDEEVSKCQLLCHDCHVDKHRSEAICGTPQRYWRGCRCDDCTRANSKYHREYKKLRKSTMGETP